jgi:hypothetical protein
MDRMSKVRSPNAKTRNVRLDIETYTRLDRFATELVTERGSRKITMDDAVKSLLDEHEKHPRK